MWPPFEFDKEDFLTHINFTSWNYYELFLQAILKHSDFKPIKPRTKIKDLYVEEHHWFRHKPTGEAWLLIRPFRQTPVDRKQWLDYIVDHPWRWERMKYSPYVMGGWKKTKDAAAGGPAGV